MKTFPTRHSNLNSLWSALLLEELWRLGIEHVCIAPGSRSAPLTLAAVSHSGLQKHVHFDERGLAFFALGLAKSSGKPVAVITTSGTAVPNLYPALVESRQSGVPLVLLTADRPPELIDCGANQAIEQQDIFAGYPGATLRLPVPDQALSANWLLTSVDQSFARSCQQGLPLHINCMFREPLYPGVQEEDYSLYLSASGQWLNSTSAHTIYETASAGSLLSPPVPWSEFMKGKGLLIAGRLGPGEDVDVILALANTLGWPVLADIQSQLHGHPDVIPHADLFLASHTGRSLIQQADRVLQFGGHIVSKRLDRFLGSHRWTHYFMLGREMRRMDTGHSQTYRMTGPLGNTGRALLEAFEESKHISHEWLSGFRSQAERIVSALNNASSSEHLSEQLSEQWIGANLSGLLPDNAALFVGNSLPIRLMDIFSTSRCKDVYTNRGASGIDGLLATAAGCAMALQKPVVLLIGDVSFLHDLNSLHLLRQLNVPLVIVLLNNDGGGIFNLLPLAHCEGSDSTMADVRDYFTTPHGLDAAHAAAMFGVQYQHPDSARAFSECLEQSFHRSGCTLIEIKTAPGEAATNIREMIALVEAL